MANNKVNIIIEADDRASAKLQKLTGVAKNFALVGAAAIAGGFVAAVNAAADFETRLGDISTLLSGDSSDAIAEFKDGILELSKAVPKSADDLGAGAYQIVSAGISDTAEALKVLKDSSELAVAGLSTTEEATNIMTSALNAFGYEAEKSDIVADILFKTVKNGKTTISEMSAAFGAAAPVMAAAHVELTEFSAATAALTTSGLPASQAQNSLRQAVVSLQKPTKEMADLFKLAEIESGELAIRQYGLVGVMDLLKEAAEGDNEALARAYGSIEALGAATSLTGNQNEAFIKTLEDMEHGARSVDEAFQKQNETFNSQFAIMKNQLNAVFIDLGSVILPVLISAMSTLINDILPALKDWFSETWATIEVVGQKISEELIPPLTDLYNNIKDNLLPELKELYDFFVTYMVPLLAITVIQAIKNTIAAIDDLVTKLSFIAQASRKVREEIGKLITKIKDVASKGKDGIKTFAKAASSALGPLGVIIQAIVSNLDKIVAVAGKAKDAIESVTGAGGDSTGGGFLSGLPLVGPILNGINLGEQIGDAATRATGGTVTGNTPYLVGERGPELFTPSNSGMITNASGTGEAMGSNVTINGNIMLGDRGAVDRFFERIDSNQQLATAGMS